MLQEVEAVFTVQNVPARHPACGAATGKDAQGIVKAGGFNPVQARKLGQLKAAASVGQTFEAVARDWYAKRSPGWSSHHQIRELRNLEKDLLPWLGTRNAGEIEAVELLATVRRVEARGSLDVAHRVLSTARGVLAYAVATGVAGRNVALDLQGALTPHQRKHFAAITAPPSWGSCCAPYSVIKVAPWCVQPWHWPPCFSSAPTSCVAWHGMSWI